MLGADADPKHVTLPPPEEREWLLEQTAKLLAADGWAGYVRAPLLEPTAEFFPDRWAGGEASVRRLLLRLLRYAGHPEHDVEVVIHEADPARRGEVIAKLEQPDNQRLIDLTGVALGFGLLTTDACQRFYAKSAGGFRATRAQFRLGALSVQDMSFLLALQFEARGLDRRTRKQSLARLQPNQAGFVREAADWLARLDPPIRARLRIPGPEQWPAAPDLQKLYGPLADPRRPGQSASPEQLVAGSGVFEQQAAEDDERDEPRRDIDKGIRDSNRGKPVFRIERSGALRMAKVLGFPVLLLGALFSRGGNFGIEIPTEYVMPTALVLAVAGLAIGSLFTDRRCSEPKCGSKLREQDEVCPLCGGVVMGVIHHPRERLGAEEELVRTRKVSAEGLVVGWTDPDEDEDDEEADDEVEEQQPQPLTRAS